MRAPHPRTLLLLPLSLLALAAPILRVEAQLKTGAEKKNAKDGATMVYVAPGEFTMGADDGYENEKPVHKVKMTQGYWIYKTEVTNGMYGKFLAANPKATKPKYWADPRFKAPDQPVVGVAWAEADAYCKWAGVRLPSEAEWEYAARGTDGRKFPWGNEVPDAARTTSAQDEATGKPGPAGKLPTGASPCGALDMAGNVWEWCADWYDRSTYAAPAADNPAGPKEGQERVIRGGSWFQPPFYLRATYRNRATPDTRTPELGLRPAANG
jgi:formylglycine-generating enzyme required for sulfatase activity